MSICVRLFYEKRMGACFVPHIALAQLFTRAAARAGLFSSMTEGFTPRAKISFGPELPAGVVALREPVDIYLEVIPDDFPDGLLSRLNACMPEGFRILEAVLPTDGSPSLGKECAQALYKVRPVKGIAPEVLLQSVKEVYGDDVLSAKEDDCGGWFSFILAKPAQNGIGRWVKELIASETVTGWQDLNIVRAAIKKDLASFSTKEGGEVCLQTEK